MYLSEYEKGLCAGDTAFRIGGKQLYAETKNGIKEMGYYNHRHDLTVEPEKIQYARGYIYGYESAKNSCLNRY